MHITKTRLTRTSIVFVLVLMMATITLMADKPVKAEYYDTSGQRHDTMGGPIPNGITPDVIVPTQAYLAVTPNPVGLGQSILVNVWLTPATHVSRYHSGFKVTIIKPDESQTVKTMDSYYADATAWFETAADQVGTWKFKFEFLGDYYAAGNYTQHEGAFMLFGSGDQNISFTKSCYYEPSSTPETLLTVQEDLVASWPAVSLPTDYWTRPVSPENREWWSILGNYPATGVVGGGTGWPADTNPYATGYYFVPYVQSPATAHVVWRKQTAIQGLLGGNQYQTSLVGQFGGGTPAVIFQGRCYQSITRGNDNLLQCYDLRTGEVYWEIPDPIPVVSFFGMRFAGTMLISYDQGHAEVPGGGSSFGAGASLVCLGTNLVKIDPFSGQTTLNTTGMSGTLYADPYVLSVQNIGTFFAPNYRLINWSIAGTSTNFASRIVSNISWPLSSLPTTTDFNTGVAVSVGSIDSNDAVGTAIGTTLQAVNLKTGAKMWNASILNDFQYSGSTAVADHGKIAVLMMGGYWKAWDLNTGTLSWTSEKMAYPWGLASFGDYGVQSAYGLFYRESYDGVYAFRWSNGKIAWHFMAPSVPFETPYSGNYSFNGGAVIADGKLYTFNTEHTPSQPITRGWRLFCINATSGEGIWNITGSMSAGPVADGYLTAGNAYDGYTYAFGKGQSETTITAPQTAIAKGQSIILTGTVLDQSPAQPGTPCVSAESMTVWMEYLHMQHQIPMDVIGVPVSLDAVDPNGNAIHIATVTTDMSGHYGYLWKPDFAGQYTVTATFAGDESYGSSYDETFVGVDQAGEASPTATATSLTLPPFEIYTVGTGIAVIIAVAIATLLILRKKP